ncbi:MAG: radical SAM protein [Deltaproteobacteria bacterium]|nr:radical SAM protein [Deltaproteobacteria bacterium]
MGIDVALVGREERGDENLALRYLAAALAQAGHRPHVIPLCGPESLGPAAAAIRKLGAPLVGISIPDADIAVDGLAFVRYLRGGGYRGHVTCGGALATLVRHEILGKHGGVDTVVRHDGEATIVAMAERIAEGKSCVGVPGVSTREGDGAPAPVADPAPLRLRPMRPAPLPRILGVPVARMLASRGCPGRCPYCGPAALQREAVEEGVRGGLDRETLHRAGVGGTRRRSAGEVADEVAELYHGQGVRLFHLLDDNLLSGGAEAAAEWLRTVRRELEGRGVGKTAWSLQTDPAIVTEDVANALEELGVIRVLLGVEGLTAEGLRALGRPGDPGRNLEAIERLRGRGVVTLFNSLLVHPQASPASISAELDGLAGLRGVHFEAIAMAVYPGTEAWRSLCEAGQVTGGMFGWRFEPRDPVASRFRAAVIRLRLEGSGRYGASVFAHDVAVNLAMARRLGLAAWNADLEHEFFGVLDEMNAVRLAAWRSALDLSATEMAKEDRALAVAGLVTSLRGQLARYMAHIDRLEARMERAERVRRGKENLLVRSALAAGFTLLLAPAAGCYGSHGEQGGGEADGGGEVESDGGGGEVESDGGGGEVESDGGGDGACTTEETTAEFSRALTAVRTAPCPACTGTDGSVPYGIAIDATGRVVDVVTGDGTAVPDVVRSCYLEALGGERFPCLGGEEIWQECVICIF